MPRSERLFPLLDALRRHRRPVSSGALAAELGVSVRTVYRDIAALKAQGAEIEGEAGVGYVLRPGFTLPPLMLSAEEFSALSLGARWVAMRGDPPLAEAALNAIAKIAAVVPEPLRHAPESLLVPPGGGPDPARLALVRQAIARERKVRLAYVDGNAARTERTVWPVAIGYFDAVRMIVAWCELRDGFRHFRADRLEWVALLDVRIPRRRTALLAQWRREQGISG